MSYTTSDAANDLHKYGDDSPANSADTSIDVGDVVRSFDFDHHELSGERACYVVGRVVAITWLASCYCYVIEPITRIFGGEVCEVNDTSFTVPLNGTPTSMGRITSGVVKA